VTVRRTDTNAAAALPTRLGRLARSKAPRTLVAVIAGCAMVLGGVVGTTISAQASPGQVVTDLTTTTPADLVSTILGPGVTASNVTYEGDDVAAGTFSGMNAVGFSSGITLSTGDAVDVVGPNNRTNKSTILGTDGDADLDALTGGFGTTDAAALSFDFVPTTSTLIFDYVFGSEEYSEFANTKFNDVFAFYVNGRNCALTPDGQPVSVNTINNGNPTGDLTPHRPELLRDNTPDAQGVAPIDVQADGLTVVLRCVARVNAGVPNTMKLAIADGSDGTYDSMVFIRAHSVTTNHAPAAAPVSVSTIQDTSVVATLQGTDADGDGLTYTVQTQPTHGTLTGTGPSLTYTPQAGYTGPDSFTYTVNDGLDDSTPATVSIAVKPPNHAPTATGIQLTTAQDTAAPVTLAGSDVDGDALSYSVLGAPSHGTLSGTAPSLTYTPAAGYSGADSFTYKVNDGALDSDAATVAITVTPAPPPNRAPSATALNAFTQQDTPVDVTLSGSDPDGDDLTYAVATAPAHGVLSGTVPNLTYTPATGYSGPDSFTYTVNDADLTSPAARVSITVMPAPPPNHAPVANDLTESTDQDSAVSVALSGTDPDGDPITYSVLTSPAHGSLSGTAPALTYTPDAGFSGSDAFTYRVNDGSLNSAAATVHIQVIKAPPPNHAPTATDIAVTTDEGSPVDVSLSGSDSDGDALTYTVLSQPDHGTLSGTAPALTYTPEDGYSGPDSFTYKVNDGSVDSAPATVGLTVIKAPPLNHTPAAEDIAVTTDHDTSASITLKGTDVDDDPLTYSVIDSPMHGILTGTVPNLTYVPDPGYGGPDSFTYKVNDGAIDSEPATVSITVRPVSPVNHAPTAADVAASTNQDVATAVTLNGSDPDGDDITYSVRTEPDHGILSGTAPNLLYSPDAGYSGADSFTYVVNDGAVDSPVATVHIAIEPTPTQCATAPKLIASVSADTRFGASKIGSAALSADRGPKLLLAFVQADGPSLLKQTVTSVRSENLTWTLAVRSNRTGGTTEIWQAHTDRALHNLKATARLARSGFGGSITLAAFSGAADTVGAVAGSAGVRGPAAVTLDPMACGSLVWASGHDWSHSVSPKPASGQRIVHAFVDRWIGDTFWTQQVLKPTQSASVTVQAYGLNQDRWTMAAVEIRAATEG